MKPICLALLLSALGSIALFAFGLWLGSKPVTAIGIAALFAAANMAASMALIRRAQRAQAQKGQA